MELLTAALARELLPLRPEHQAKWSFGRALLLCGSTQFSGAALLSAEAALRSGAGLVQLCSAPEVIAAARVRLPEALLQALPPEDEDCTSVVEQAMAKSTAILLGCGSGISARGRALLRQVLPTSLPLALDADGLNLLAEEPGLLRLRQGPAVLTPHRGEFCRLTGLSAAALEADPGEHARQLAARYGVTVVLKGAVTHITDGARQLRLDAPNSGLAKGGSGDVLAGLCAGLLAQGMSPLEAGALAVWLHSRAGALARAESGPYAMLPRDVLAQLPRAFLSLEDA